MDLKSDIGSSQNVLHMISFFSYETGTGPMALAVMLYMCVLHLILNDVHAKSYPNSGTWGVGGGGGKEGVDGTSSL